MSCIYIKVLNTGFRGNITNNENEKKSIIFYVFDFYGVENFMCDIAPEHYINDLFMQKANNGKILFDCDAGLQFSFAKARANRFWVE